MQTPEAILTPDHCDVILRGLAFARGVSPTGAGEACHWVMSARHSLSLAHGRGGGL